MKSVILKATMSPAYSLDQIQHNEKQLRHFKVSHAYNQEMASKMAMLEQQMEQQVKYSKCFITDNQ